MHDMVLKDRYAVCSPMDVEPRNPLTTLTLPDSLRQSGQVVRNSCAEHPFEGLSGSPPPGLFSCPGGEELNVTTLFEPSSQVRNAGAERQLTALLGTDVRSASPQPPKQCVLMCGTITRVDTTLRSRTTTGPATDVTQLLLLRTNDPSNVLVLS